MLLLAHEGNILLIFALCDIFAVQLLQKLSITAVGKREKLLRVIKNPVTQYLPVSSKKIGELELTYNSLAYHSHVFNFLLSFQVSHIVQKNWSK